MFFPEIRDPNEVILKYVFEIALLIPPRHLPGAYLHCANVFEFINPEWNGTKERPTANTKNLG